MSHKLGLIKVLHKFLTKTNPESASNSPYSKLWTKDAAKWQVDQQKITVSMTYTSSMQIVQLV